MNQRWNKMLINTFNQNMKTTNLFMTLQNKNKELNSNIINKHKLSYDLNKRAKSDLSVFLYFSGL